LAATRRSRTSFSLELSAALCVCLFSLAARAQCSTDPSGFPVHELFQQHKWEEVVRSAESLPSRSADINFEYGIALAHLQQWPKAHDVLIAGRRQCPGQKRFPIELAGIAFQNKQYPEAASFLRSALRIDPHDEYAINFAATVYFLMGNLDAALKYWNQLHKPSIANLRFDPNLRTHLLLLDRSFTFAPASLLERSQFASTDTRLRNLGIFPTYNISLISNPNGTFDADFHALELNGFGASRLQALVAIFGGAAYETIYPSYYNIGRSATIFESLLRWDAQKRRAWFSLSGPLHELPQWRWQLSNDDRNENWIIRRSFTGSAPALGSLNLQRQTISATITALSCGRVQCVTGLEVSHRTFRNIAYGSAFTPALVSPGFQLKHLASIHDTLINVPEHRFSINAGGTSEFARLWSNPPRVYEKLQGSALARWFPEAAG
jgi:tetratricopeptide (TPR) repeat protein